MIAGDSDSSSTSKEQSVWQVLANLSGHSPQVWCCLLLQAYSNNTNRLKLSCFPERAHFHHCHIIQTLTTSNGSELSLLPTGKADWMTRGTTGNRSDGREGGRGGERPKERGGGARAHTHCSHTGEEGKAAAGNHALPTSIFRLRCCLNLNSKGWRAAGECEWVSTFTLRA